MSRLLHNPDLGFCRGGVSTLPSVFALLRPAQLLALLDRSDLERHRSPAAEDFLPELSLGKVALPVSRVSLCQAAPAFHVVGGIAEQQGPPGRALARPR